MTEKLKKEIAYQVIIYWIEKKEEQKSSLLSLIKEYRVLMGINEKRVSKIEPFEALKVFLNENKPAHERINILISSL